MYKQNSFRFLLIFALVFSYCLCSVSTQAFDRDEESENIDPKHKWSLILGTEMLPMALHRPAILPFRMDIGIRKVLYSQKDVRYETDAIYYNHPKTGKQYTIYEMLDADKFRYRYDPEEFQMIKNTIKKIQESRDEFVVRTCVEFSLFADDCIHVEEEQGYYNNTDERDVTRVGAVGGVVSAIWSWHPLSLGHSVYIKIGVGLSKMNIQSSKEREVLRESNYTKVSTTDWTQFSPIIFPEIGKEYAFSDQFSVYCGIRGHFYWVALSLNKSNPDASAGKDSFLGVGTIHAGIRYSFA